MPWKDSPASVNPDIVRNTITWQVTKSGGGTVNENFILDLNQATGSYIVYRVDYLTQAEIPVITSDKINGKYQINLESGSTASPIGVDQLQYIRLTQTKLAEIADNQRKSYYQQNGPQTASDLGIPGFNNTANSNPVSPVKPIGSNGDGALGQTQPSANPNATSTISQEVKEYAGVKSRTNYDNLVYPSRIRDTKQDYIIFTQKEYGPKLLKPLEINNKDNKRSFGTSLGSVVLPIQPQIMDSNAVTWGDDRLNALKAGAAAASLNAMTSSKGFAGSLLDDAAVASQLFANSGDLQNAVRAYLAGQAVGAENLLSRTSGAVLNPNLELLFSGPTLRPFSFTFQLSPRDNKESAIVKKIIRYFKQGMSVKRGDKNLFLKAPNVFDIRYIYGESGKDHTSLNRIKTCALQTCGVDYAPNGTYMTFNDGTMVTYNLALQFTELEPVYSDDYDDIDGNQSDSAGIGY
jgi:hypothetical protein